MNDLNKIVIVFSLFFCFGCKKEVEGIGPPTSNSTKPQEEAQLVAICDDTSAFKTDWDFQPLTYVEDCFLCRATKEVPGLDSASWTMNSRAEIGNTIGLVFETYTPFGQALYLRETVSFAVPPVVGFHSVGENYASYIRTISDGDVIDAIWDIDTNCANIVEITQIDFECEEVRGKFDLHFILSDPKSGIPHSDRINFTNGKFEARFKHY